MTAHKRKEWYIVAKNKRLTNKEKQARAELKKRMQDKGVLPPDKPKLNRKKFIDEAREEWNGRSSDCFIWEHYLMDAMSKRDYIDAGSIQTTVNFDGHIYHIRIAFRRTDSNSEYNIDIESNGVEVIVE